MKKIRKIRILDLCLAVELFGVGDRQSEDGAGVQTPTYVRYAGEHRRVAGADLGGHRVEGDGAAVRRRLLVVELGKAVPRQVAGCPLRQRRLVQLHPKQHIQELHRVVVVRRRLAAASNHRH